jgi:hypothetical protein
LCHAWKPIGVHPGNPIKKAHKATLLRNAAREASAATKLHEK